MKKQYPFYSEPERFDSVVGRGSMPERWYVIGDVHGCWTALDSVLKNIGEDIAANGAGKHNKIIFVGDYIDRGPQSYEVIDNIIKLKNNPTDFLNRRYQLELLENWRMAGLPQDQWYDLEVVTLEGNHERMLCDALEESYYPNQYKHARMSGDGKANLWIMNGGFQAIESYLANTKSTDFTLPPHHLSFLMKTQDCYYRNDCSDAQDQTWMVVHAGVQPGLSLHKHQPGTYLWIRHEYINHDFTATLQPATEDGGEVDLRIISGHTPVKNVVETGGKVLLDTGCVFGHKLTCCVFQTNQEFKVLAKFEAEQPQVKKRDL